MPLVAGLVLALACTVVNAKVYTFTEQEGKTIFAPYSKLEDAKPGESVAAYSQLFQKGVVVGDAWWTGVKLPKNAYNWQLTIVTNSKAETGAGQLHLVGFGTDSTEQNPDRLSVVNGNGAFKGKNNGSLRWTSKLVYTLELN